MLNLGFANRSRRIVGASVVVGCFATVAWADFIDSAIVKTRIFNDDPDSIVSSTNLYPALISIKDEKLDGNESGGGFANRHNFHLSGNGGISDYVFLNDTAFAFYADVQLTGTANSEGGLNVSPWWSQDVDGQFMINATSGEVAVFGGRLPFYSFTGNHGVTYAKGSTIRQGVIYDPNSLTELDPGTIEYIYTDDTGTYSSGKLNFDMGNPDEDPPYGLFGILNDARVGGYFQPLIASGNPDNFGEVFFTKMEFIPEPATLGVLLLGGLVLIRRARD